MKNNKFKTIFKKTSNPGDPVVVAGDRLEDYPTYLYKFSCAGYEYNKPGYFHDRENGNSYMFNYTVSGSATIKYNGKTLILKPGDLCILDMTPRSIISVDSDHWEIFFGHFYNENLNEFYFNFLKKYGYILHNFDAELFNNNCLEIVNLERNNGTKEAISKKIYEIIMYISEKYLKLNDEEQDISGCITFILKNYSNKITIDDLCNISNFSKRHLTRKFIEITGKSPIQYLNDYRLTVARGLLLSTHDSIKEIAERTGFSNARNLNYQFYKKYEITPTGLRNSWLVIK